MIVCSQTCFLNILTQLYPKEVLLNAQYYIADLTGPDGIRHLNPDNIENQMMNMMEDTVQYKYNEDGELVKTSTGTAKSIDTLQRYHVIYTGGCLNPTSLLTNTRIGPEVAKLSPVMRFVRSLQNTESAIEIYHDLFFQEPRGNGLQILIYSNDKICCEFGWVTCEYLSSCFGADILYIDAKYRKKIAPQSRFEYKGNKEFALKTFIPKIRDDELLASFKRNLTKSDLRECSNNISAKINVMSWESLIHLHDLLWPMDPLPQGNYTVEQLREIIMYKCIGSRKPTLYDQFDNLHAADAFYQMANEYDL